ncbi:hypothetical protein ACVIWU_007053 [Bradyrhizobium sp. USDA 4509]
MHVDKLDGRIDNTIYNVMSGEWRKEQDRCSRKIVGARCLRVRACVVWWAWQDSNLQPVRYERTALTIELQAPLLRRRRSIVYNLSGAPARLSHASAPALRTFPQVFLSVL